MLKKSFVRFSAKQIHELTKTGSAKIQIGGETIQLTPEDVNVERKVKEGLAAGNEGELTVALDTTLNDELLMEGLAREIVNKINTMRRDMEFEVIDRIKIEMQTTDRVKECFKIYGSMIQNEVLAVDVQFKSVAGEALDLNGEETILAIHKVKKA